MLAAFPIPPVVLKTSGVKDPCSMSQIRCSYILFFAFSWKVYRDDSGCCRLVCALGLNTFTSKNARCCEQVGLIGPWPYHFLGNTYILDIIKKAF